ncbi:hypothetical protein [Flavobacterium sp. AG291]|uniref:hypothetical protein n=1 Tax=Flavobacterium sp. AG291 TaxID=2184000 RepID=UPI000E0C2236|nr:hypothetical protein [Flavobacterium sp. AG291]RDI07076.1 hypothetical protein DEU42_113176 [Flavobacterium sp. AG291]
MNSKFSELKDLLEAACRDVHKDFLTRFNNDTYISAGGAKLEAFITELQKEYESIAVSFLQKHGFEKDADAKKKVLAIIKAYAKRCIEEFSKI